MPIVLPEKKAVLLKLHNPKRVTDVIPTAKLVRHRNTLLVAVPHRPDETKVLRNMGFDVPEPMLYYYDWPGRFTPFQAQRDTSAFIARHSRVFVLNSMGTGKTASALWTFDYLRRSRSVHRALVVCPLSTMERTWADEAFRLLPELTVAVLHGDRARRLKLLEAPADLYVVNHDGLKIIAPALAQRSDIDLVIVDELATFRNAQTERWKSLNLVCNRQTPRRVWGLTGAPTPNGPMDAWAQCRLVTPTNPLVPRYASRFRDQVMRQVSPFKWLPREGAMDIVRDTMQPAIRFTLADCIDLPEQIFIERQVDMSPEQRRAYKEMLSRLRTEYDGGEIQAINEAVKAAKLLQIACGVAYGQNGETVVLPAPERLAVLRELIEETEGKVLVFVPLTGVLKAVAAELAKDFSVAVVYGETSKTERDEIFARFQNATDPRVIVANPGTMSHGLTLTAATTVVWYAPIYSNDIYEQACARVRRPGQTRTTVIAHVAASEIERRIYERLQGKQKLQGLLLDLMEQQVMV